MQKTSNALARLKRAAVILLVVAALCAGGFLWYVSDYYRAEDVALEVAVQGVNLSTQGNLTILSPSQPSDTALLFYPGAKVEGLILLGAYIYGDYPEENTLTVYGSLNQSVEDHLDYTRNIVEIEGGNHAQFGNYGPQKGDPPAAISAQEQQAQTVDAIEAFLDQRAGDME